MDLKLLIQIVVGIILSIAGSIVAFLEENKNIVSDIALRIEKDSKDGWTRKEKEKFAIDMYFGKAQKLLPWYLRLFSRMCRHIFLEKLIKILIGQLCKKSHELKEK